jgi:predicted lipoprotein with Yx(FWY)xxD motif
MRKRIAITSIVLTLVASGAAFAAALTGTKVTLHSTNRGKVLATSTGRTLYLSIADGRNKSRCTSANGCASLWPPLLTKGTPIAGTGVKQALLGTLKRGTKLQVSYNGHPLYTWSSDSKAGQATGENINGFFVVKPSGTKG